MKMLIYFFISPLVAPILPYWLRLRYKCYMVLSSLRKQALIDKYRRMALEKKWRNEPWTVIDDEQVPGELGNDVKDTI